MADSQTDRPSSDPPVPVVHLRGDLIIRKQHAGGEPNWVIKDPVTMRYFSFDDDEYMLLRMLDGASNLERVRQQYEAARPEKTLSPPQLREFVAELVQHELLEINGPAQGERLLGKGRQRRRVERFAAFLNPLAIRLPGIDPERLLDWLYPKLRWLFSWWFVWLSAGLIFYAIVIVAFDWRQFQYQLVDWERFVSVENLVWLAIVLASTKMFHELGHALLCRHLGGECHEMGILLLVFTPCLYCDVSDSWILANRWHRMLIAAAGIWVDLLLAAIAAVGWVHSGPGFLNAMCLNVMVVCGFGTILLNGNPLLRYDGYYVLSDLVDVPNLWHRSRAEVHAFFRRWMLGDRGSAARRVRRRGTLLVYGVLSMIYRVVVLVTIVFLLYRVFTPLGLRAAVDVVVAIVVGGIALSGTQQLVRFFRDPRWWASIRATNTGVTAAALTCLVAMFVYCPFPAYLCAPAVLQYGKAERVYVSSPGVLQSSVQVGDQVVRSQILARLDDARLLREIARLEDARRLQQLRLRHLETLQLQSLSSGELIPAARELLDDLDQQLEEKRRSSRLLELTSPCDGTVIPPRRRGARTDDRSHLRRWHGIPIESRNQSCYLERGDLLCLVGDPRDFEAVAVVDPAELGRLKPMQTARVIVESGEASILHGKVHHISRQDLQIVPVELAIDRRVASRKDVGGADRPIEASFVIRIELQVHDLPLVHGMPGRVVIQVAHETLLSRLQRFWYHTFRA